MDLIFVADCLEGVQPLLKTASKADHRILKLTGFYDTISSDVASLCPDALIFVSDEINRVLLREMRAVSRLRATPIIVFTHDSQARSIDAAVKAGATVYVVDCDNPERLASLLGVAKARFAQQQRLNQELMQTKMALVERKNIEKAKGLIMKTKSLSEDDAYKAMRKLAMSHNKRIAEVAVQIIAAAEVLI